MKIEMSIDPMEKFPGIGPNDLYEMGGYLNSWIRETEFLHTEDRPVTMKDSLLAHYPYFMGEMTGGTLSEKGVFSFPGDPDLYPVIKYYFGEEKCFIFRHAIVGIINEDGSTWVTRMD